MHRHSALTHQTVSQQAGLSLCGDRSPAENRLPIESSLSLVSQVSAAAAQHQRIPSRPASSAASSVPGCPISLQTAEVGIGLSQSRRYRLGRRSQGPYRQQRFQLRIRIACQPPQDRRGRNRCVLHAGAQRQHTMTTLATITGHTLR